MKISKQAFNQNRKFLYCFSTITNSQKAIKPNKTNKMWFIVKLQS